MKRRTNSFGSPRYDISFRGWQAVGDFMGFDYSIADAAGNPVAVV